MSLSVSLKLSYETLENERKLLIMTTFAIGFGSSTEIFISFPTVPKAVIHGLKQFNDNA